jgi:hypothetical protein
MTIVFEKLANEPIVISTTSEPLHSERDVRRAIQALTRYLQEISGNIYYISDTTQLNPPSFADIVLGLATLAQNKKGPLSDPRLRTYVVASAEMLILAADSVHQTQYGEIDVKLFSSKEDALRDARTQITRDQ